MDEIRKTVKRKVVKKQQEQQQKRANQMKNIVLVILVVLAFLVGSNLFNIKDISTIIDSLTFQVGQHQEILSKHDRRIYRLEKRVFKKEIAEIKEKKQREILMREHDTLKKQIEQLHFSAGKKQRRLNVLQQQLK